MKEIKELFAIIPNYPGLNICLVDDGSFDVCDDFVKLCEEKEATLFLKDLKGRYKDLESSQYLKVEKFDFEDRRYNNHSVLYDFIFLCCDVPKDKRVDVLKKFYRVLKNAGDIYLFFEDDPIDTRELLEGVNYVAVNEIDSMGSRHIVSAKKMHGWMKV